jgi:hypothetical protein
VPDGAPPHEDTVVPLAPACSNSQELRIALEEFTIKSDKATLEKRAEPLQNNASVNYSKCRPEACVQAAEPKEGKATVLAAVSEIYLDAMKFWQHLEEGTAKRLAQEGQEAMVSLETCSEYKGVAAAPATVASGLRSAAQGLERDE